ncbi:IS4 family transposase [Halomonas sp. C05BenzN]|uniref:IS4 family transposase n=1 Tax=Halomonas sp. C05BenzN TaxID=3411041 RepID=UPI003B9596AD
MQTLRFLHKILADSAPVVNALRLKSLLAAVQALIDGQRLGLTALGRHLPGDTAPKHAIKRMDRLLGNPHLQQERPLFYWLVTPLLVGNTPHPRILVDWSPIDDRGQHFVLRAAIPFAGRSFPIYEKVHHKDACPVCQRHLLDALAELLPEGTQPILVTDAGFKGPWFREVEARGWYYVGRLRRPTHLRLSGEEWEPVADLFAGARRTPEALGKAELVKKSPLSTRAYRVRHVAKGRRHLTKQGKPSRAKRSLKAAKGHREPWVLVSNLPASFTSAKKVVAIYRQRMQIEEGFRDVKSPLFGLGFGMHQTRSARRIEILLLIAMLASLVMLICGLKIHHDGDTQRFQSNSLRSRSVLSVWRLGREALRHSPNLLSRCRPDRLTEFLRREVITQHGGDKGM